MLRYSRHTVAWIAYYNNINSYLISCTGCTKNISQTTYLRYIYPYSFLIGNLRCYTSKLQLLSVQKAIIIMRSTAYILP